jgi:hypothetical protein
VSSEVSQGEHGSRPCRFPDALRFGGIQAGSDGTRHHPIAGRSFSLVSSAWGQSSCSAPPPRAVHRRLVPCRSAMGALRSPARIAAFSDRLRREPRAGRSPRPAEHSTSGRSAHGVTPRGTTRRVRSPGRIWVPPMCGTSAGRTVCTRSSTRTGSTSTACRLSRSRAFAELAAPPSSSKTDVSARGRHDREFAEAWFRESPDAC